MSSEPPSEIAYAKRDAPRPLSLTREKVRYRALVHHFGTVED